MTTISTILITWFLIGIGAITMVLISIYLMDRYPKTKFSRLIRKHLIDENEKINE